MKNIFYILFLILFLTSCATSKNYSKFHKKHEQKAADSCAIWYPIKENTVIREVTNYKPGETKEVPGETEYLTIDCDSLANSAAKTKKVTVKVPSKIRVDTFFKDRTFYVENTAYKMYMQDSINYFRNNYQKQNAQLVSAKKTKNYLIYGLIGLLVVNIIAWYIRLKVSYSRR